MEDNFNVDCFTEDDEVPVTLEFSPNETVKDLKEKYYKNEGVKVSTLYCNVMKLEKEHDVLEMKGFKEIGYTTFFLEGHFAGNNPHEISVDKDTWVFTQGRSNANPPIKITPNNIHKIKISKGKFAIVTDTEEGKGKNGLEYKIYQAVRYNVEKDGRIDLRTDEKGEVVVFLVTEEGPNGEETKLEGELMTYDASRFKSTLERTYMGSRIFGNIGKFGNWINRTVFGVHDMVNYHAGTDSQANGEGLMVE